MKKVYVFATLLLMAGMAMGQYTVKNVQIGAIDVTMQTTTVNAWKQFASGVCINNSLVDSIAGPYCIGTDNHVYRFNLATKKWDQQTAMGTANSALAVVAPNNIYVLQSFSQCTYPDQELFNWNGTGLTQKNRCFRQISTDPTGFVAGLQTNGQLYSSPDGGNTWNLQGGNWFYVSLGGNSQSGCAIGSDRSVWILEPPNYETPLKLANLPSGTAVGCVYANSPTTVMVWTATGAVYSMPEENFGTWQSVTGLSVTAITGLYRSRILALNSSGTPFHWNVNAPTVSATYGGQWNASNGCPAPGSICHPTTTHTITHQVRFKTGHGLGGQKNSSTQVFTNDIEVSSSDTNPGCDPLFGVPTDVECYAVMSGGAECNQANAAIGSEGVNYVVADSTDVQDYTYYISSSGPMGVSTGPQSGYYLGEVVNATTEACYVTDPVPVCPAQSPANITVRAPWWGGPAFQQAAYNFWYDVFDDSKAGLDSPYVYDTFYLGEADANGNLIPGTQICFGDPHRPTDFLNGNADARPHCK